MQGEQGCEGAAKAAQGLPTHSFVHAESVWCSVSVWLIQVLLFRNFWNLFPNIFASWLVAPGGTEPVVVDG